jgi:hypothetical protein
MLSGRPAGISGALIPIAGGCWLSVILILLKKEIEMIHASESYNRIQDPENKIGQDEPVFLLRAQDALAPITVSFWADCVEKAGNAKLAEEVRNFVVKMAEWQRENFTKYPD